MIHLDISNIVIGGLIIFSIIRWTPIIIHLIKYKYLKYLMKHKREINKVISGIDKELSKKKIASAIGERLLLDKVSALMMVGEFSRASENIRLIKQTKLSKKQQLAYSYCKTRILFELQRIEEAQEELEKYYNKIGSMGNTTKYKVMTSKLQAINMYYSNSTKESEEILLSTKKISTSEFSKGEINLYLALVNLKLNNKEDAKKYLLIAKDLGYKTFIEKKAIELLNDLRQS